MYRILSASKDTYITNKITRNSFRAEDANTGKAGTLDLFKLYAENVSGSDITPTEISRLLIKFDLSKLRTMLREGEVDINSNNFKVMMNLKDVYGGQTTPNNFKVIAFPLAKSFDEGIGRDIINYNDLDASNFLTASVSNGVVNLWNRSGARASGSLGQPNLDVFVSGTLQGPLGNQTVALCVEQKFNSGEEDLKLDITKVISGTLSNQIDDNGFCIALSGSFEQDTKTYFVKRFGSRHASKFINRPFLSVEFDDSIIDNHENFIFNVTGSLFLNNFHRGVLSNILTGEAAAEVGGNNCMKLIIRSGSYEKTVNVSQHKIGTVFQTGIYSASFAINEFNSNLKEYLKNNTSASFDLFWSSNNGAIGYLTSSLHVNKNLRTSFNGSDKRLMLTIENLKSSYIKSEKTKLRIFIEDRDRAISFQKGPFETISQVFNNIHYRVVDVTNNRVVIPFDTTQNSTRLSSDSKGMYFFFHMDSLFSGNLYKFEFLIKDLNRSLFIDDASAHFTVADDVNKINNFENL